MDTPPPNFEKWLRPGGKKCHFLRQAHARLHIAIQQVLVLDISACEHFYRATLRFARYCHDKFSVCPSVCNVGGL